MAKTYFLDEKQLIEYFGDVTRPDVFPGTCDYAKVARLSKNAFCFVDNTGKTVLLFEFDNKNKVTSLYSPKNVQEVLEFNNKLSEVDSKLANYLEKILTNKTKNDELGKVKLNNGYLLFKPHYDISKVIFEYDKKKNEEALELIVSYKLDKLPSSKKLQYDGDLENVVTVAPKEYAIVNESGTKKIANTFGLTDYIGLVLYDQNNNVASVAHIDRGVNISASIPKLLEDLAEAGGKSYQARLFGGYKKLTTKFIEIVKELKKREINIAEVELSEDGRYKAIGVSTKGELFNDIFDNNDSTFGNRMVNAKTLVNVPLKCYYKPKSG